MKKLTKLMPACICVVFIAAVIGLGIWKMTYTSPAADSSIHNTESETGGNIDNTNNGTDSIKITTSDGTELILMNPPMLGDNPDAYEWWLTPGDEKCEDMYNELPVN